MAMSTGLCTRCNRTHLFPVMETRIKFSFRIQYNSDEAADIMKKAIKTALTEPIFQPMSLMGLSRQVIRQTMKKGRFYFMKVLAKFGISNYMNQILF